MRKKESKSKNTGTSGPRPFFFRPSRLLLAAQLGRPVGHVHVQLGGAGDDRRPLARRHVVRDLGGVRAVVHEQQVQVGLVVDDEFEEA